MANYELSRLAEEDLRRVLDWGIEEYGEAQATDYYDGLVARFEFIAEQPLMYQAVDEVRAGYRRCTYKRESIYYQVIDGRVYIRRILEEQSTDVQPL